MSSTTPEERRSAIDPAFGGSTATLDPEPKVEQIDAASDASRAGSLSDNVRLALQLWLTWNAAQEELTESMFKVGHNSAMLEDLADQIEQLRKEAVSVSEQLIGY